MTATKATIGRDGAFAVKVFPKRRSDAHIASIVALTRELRSYGVPTPKTSPDFQAHGIRLPWIDGPTLKQRLGQAGPVRTLHELSSRADELSAAMEILRGLHSVDVQQHDLKVFSPFRRIDRRLAPPKPAYLPPAFYSMAEQLRAILGARMPEPAAHGIVHGDFHAGQLIQDRATGKWWVIDLDDVARGYPEADVANFCAHLATSRKVFEADALTAYHAIMAIVVGAYKRPLDNERLNVFAAAAFLRRALKKAERGETGARISTLFAAGLELVLGHGHQNHNAAPGQ